MQNAQDKKIKREWLPVVSHVLQTIAALGILPTVFFSWKTLEEARLTREDQSRYFLAEKAPRLVVSKAYFIDDQLMIEVKNEGESTASNIAVAKGFVRPNGTAVDDWELTPVQLDEIQKGEAARLHVTDADTTKGILAYLPSSFDLHRFARPQGQNGVLQVVVTYQNVFHDYKRVSADFVAVRTSQN